MLLLSYMMYDIMTYPLTGASMTYTLIYPLIGASSVLYDVSTDRCFFFLYDIMI